MNSTRFNVGGKPLFQLACYSEEGARYVRHADASASSPDRVVTAICYLNGAPHEDVRLYFKCIVALSPLDPCFLCSCWMPLDCVPAACGYFLGWGTFVLVPKQFFVDIPAWR